jgi:hypothetical protein
MLKRISIAALMLGAAFCGQRPVYAACASGFISIVDPFLNPNGSAWTGSIVYTLAYNTTAAGATVVGSRQQFNVSSGINICLAPGLYAPVTLTQGGFSYVITNSWGVPTTGGPYTVAQIQGNITLQAPGLLTSTVMLTPTSLLALATVPATLVPAPAANQIIYPLTVICQQINATTVTDDNDLLFGYGSIASFFQVSTWNILQGTGAANEVNSLVFNFAVLNNSTASYAGKPLIVYADNAVTQPGGVSGNAYITTYYFLFQVGM